MNKKVGIKVPAKGYVDGSCPNCGGIEWYEGPSGGASVNVKCAGCGMWFNNTPFGLDYLHNHHDGPKEIKWGYCTDCKKVFGGEFFIHGTNNGKGFPSDREYKNYPKCECGSQLKACWMINGFHCDDCEIRYKCYTER